MNRQTLLLLLGSAAGTLYAAPRTFSEAQAFAQQFLSQKTGQAIALTPCNRQMLSPGINAEGTVQPFYAFNDHDNHAFIIVSGSDLMRPVIGYSTTSTLPSNMEMLPENVRSWFSWLGEAYEYLEQHPEAGLSKQQMSQSFEPIAPLMGSQWGQDDPYDDLCPTGCPTGCVATATAQVFRYHFAKSGQIIHGQGSHSYQWRGKNHSVDYSQQTYDYTKMPLNARNASAEEKQELAKLSYHVGVGVDMRYEKEGSGAFNCMIPRLAKDHFGFNSLTSYICRNLFGYDEWVEIINNELQHERPVIYGGMAPEGGHAFVLEGIDQQGLYYVNWGWEGYCNGYFDITVMNSGGAGTGASVSEEGFCIDQDAVVNLCFDEGEGHYYTPLQIGKYSFTTSKTSVTKGSQITITAYNIQNYSGVDEKGYIGLVLMRGDEEVARAENNSLITAPASDGTYIYAIGQTQRKITFSKDLEDGDYQLWMYYQPKGKDYIDFLRAIHTNKSYFEVHVEGDNISINKGKIGIPVIPSDWNWESEQIETRPETISCQLYNASDETFVAQYLLVLTDPSGKKLSPINHGEVVLIAPGESKRISFDYRFTKTGKWKCRLEFIRQNIKEDIESLDGSNGEFEVILNETQGAVFQLTAAPEQLTDTIYLNREASFRLKIENQGAAYNGAMGIRFFKTASASNAISEFYCDATFQPNANGYVDLSGLIQGLKEKTVYYARAFYLYGEDYEQMDAATGIVNSLKVRIYPEPSNGIHDITLDDEPEEALVYDILGKRIELPVSQLPHGIYIINGKKSIIR